MSTGRLRTLDACLLALATLFLDPIDQLTTQHTVRIEIHRSQELDGTLITAALRRCRGKSEAGSDSTSDGYRPDCDDDRNCQQEIAGRVP